MTPQRLALLAGVDRYPYFAARSQLRSCVNDARLLAHVLGERYGFAPEGVTLLLDEDATRDGILAGLERLQARARPGDSLVFFWSGHGSQVPDREGDEPDGWDETLVPHDSGRLSTDGRHPSRPNRDVTDDEIYDWVLRASAVTPYVTVIADSCFSGTLVRGRGPRPGEKWIEPDRRPATELPPAAVRRAHRPSRRRDAGPSGFLPLSDRYVLLAACRASETAKELPPVPGEREPASAFTFFLCRELLRAPDRATCRDVVERVRLAVAAAVPAQTPQAEGARDRLPFGTERREPARHLLVEARTGARVELGGGAVHGVDPGSLWGIYPPGTHRPQGARPLGTVRVGTVRAVSSQAEVVRESAPIAAGARAFERERGPGWMRLAVAVEAEGLGRANVLDLARRIRGSRLLRLVDDPEQAEARVRVAAPGRGEDPGEESASPAVRVEQPSWAVLGRTEELLLPPVPLRQPGSAARLAGDLETRARYLNLLRLDEVDERDDANPLRGCLTAHLLRQSMDGRFRPARPGKAAGEVVYREGELLALRIRHGAGCPLYIHVLDLGLAGAIGLFYPVPGAYEPLAPGASLDVGVRPGQQMRVRIPDAYRAWARAAGQDGREGREVLMVFATTRETDLTWLAQPGFGGLPAARRPRGGLAGKLWQALAGGSREGAPAAAGGEEERWTVLAPAFLVRGAAGDRS